MRFHHAYASPHKRGWWQRPCSPARDTPIASCRISAIDLMMEISGPD